MRINGESLFLQTLVDFISHGLGFLSPAGFVSCLGLQIVIVIYLDFFIVFIYIKRLIVIVIDFAGLLIMFEHETIINRLYCSIIMICLLIIQCHFIAC